MMLRVFGTALAAVWAMGAAPAFAQESAPATSAPAKSASKDALAELFPEAEIRDVSSLDLKLLSDETLAQKTDTGGTIRKVTLEFTTWEWAGETWRNQAALYIPSDPPAAYRDAAVVFAQGVDDKGVTSARKGQPCILLIDAPGAHYGKLGAGAGMLMNYGSQQYEKTGDPRWLGYPWLARIFMRAITAAETIPAFGQRRCVVTGASKWGMGAWIAAGADSRIVGAVATSWNIGNVEQARELQARRMGRDYKTKPQAAEAVDDTAGEQLDIARSERGRKALDYVDPCRFRERLANKPVLFVDGTNDPLFPIDADAPFLALMQSDKRVIRLPNNEHNSNSPWTSAGQQMWLAHIFQGRDVPRIEAAEKAGPDGMTVTATVATQTQIKKVTLWSAVAPDRVFLKAKWAGREMQPAGPGRYEATLPAPPTGSVGYFVMVEDEDPATVPGVITTCFHEWRSEP